ncbi:MAG: 2-oxoacid:acceptor oxidoreductase family protein [Candidatus Thorarchaeota archaeon]|nr:2-oxoacid:acceptor oxidoreductase family protein [Candidatus Thorarchaeota archaeon]
MRDPFNILVAGVGGQGNLVCGRVLAEASVRSGLRPVVGDTFGASRRGGSVLTHLRIGKTDWAPLIPKGEVDILLGLEPLEALRAAVEFAGDRTVAIISQTKIPTVDVNTEKNEYPSLQKIIDSLNKLCKQVIVLDAEETLTRIGSMKMLNSYILGAMGVLTQSPLPLKIIRESLQSIFGSSSANIVAFDEGSKIVH